MDASKLFLCLPCSLCKRACLKLFISVANCESPFEHSRFYFNQIGKNKRPSTLCARCTGYGIKETSAQVRLMMQEVKKNPGITTMAILKTAGLVSGNILRWTDQRILHNVGFYGGQGGSHTKPVWPL
ncbi:hypothetical protein XENORESO_020227 [Xenotaenia resolanae]|uniref:Uncharacterized protein n=1 Tax=Xenotaenia resolanae TaxID=208358 RepID=A0ABV0WA88_9TELE